MTQIIKAEALLPDQVNEHTVPALFSVQDELAGTFSFAPADNQKNWCIEWICDSFNTQDAAQNYLNDTVLPLFQNTLHNGDLKLQWTFEILEDQNWLEAYAEQRPPVDIGQFRIYPVNDDQSANMTDLQDHQMGIIVRATSAFGDGHHPTTQGCLLAMEWLYEQGVCPWNILDMGCGSGILSIAAWHLWRAPVLAVDIDPKAVELTKHNQTINKIPHGSGNLVCERGNGFQAPIVSDKSPYELIIANILPASLKEMSEDITNVIDQNGYVILSGIPEEKCNEITEIYEKQNFKISKRLSRSGWNTLILF